MGTKIKIKKWQLVRAKSDGETLDLRGEAFVSVGKKAFCGARQSEIVMPEGVSAIKGSAFAGCKLLRNVTLPCENDIGLSVAVFRDCEQLCELKNADRISVIGARAFENCGMLTEAWQGRAPRRIGEYAFRGCRSIKSLALSADTASIGRAAFMDCVGLETVTIDARFGTFSQEMLRGCRSLGQVDLSSVRGTLPQGMLRDCVSLREVTIPGGARVIEKNALRGCTGLETVIIERGVERIGARAFDETTQLREVQVPNTLKRLGFGAFGLGKREEGARVRICVENEYMGKRMRRLLRWCGSAGCTEVMVIGKSIEERKRERRRSSLDAAPAHLLDSLNGDTSAE